MDVSRPKCLPVIRDYVPKTAIVYLVRYILSARAKLPIPRTAEYYRLRKTATQNQPTSKPKNLHKVGNWRFAQLAEFVPYFLTERLAGMWKRRVLNYMIYLSVDWDISVGIATRYGLDGPGIESRYGRDSSHPSRPALGLTQAPTQWVPGLSRGYSCRGVALTTHPIYCRGERVELYLYSPSGSSWPVIEWP